MRYAYYENFAQRRSVYVIGTQADSNFAAPKSRAAAS